MTDRKYYIVETNYVGPNQDQEQYIDADTIEIRTSPARNNSTHEVCVDGWCGTTNDWAVYAHGEFLDYDAAEKAISETFGEFRAADIYGDPYEPMDDDVVEIFKPGRYEPMTSESTGLWAGELIDEVITADTTDERIDELVDECRGELNSEGLSPHPSLKDQMERRRDELQAEVEAE